MPVLLSHSLEDKKETLRIAQHLTQSGVVNYVELFDPTVQTTDGITAKLKDRIQQSTHLMIIVSNFTEKLWWVPFELGAGSEVDKRICSYQKSSSQVPEFIKKWPVLRNQRGLDAFIRCYKQDTLVALAADHGDTKRISSPDLFNKELKKLIQEGDKDGKPERSVLKIRP